MPKIEYTVKGETIVVEREKVSECIEVLVETGHINESETVGALISTGCQKADYQKNHAPNTPSNVKRREEKANKPKKEATVL